MPLADFSRDFRLYLVSRFCAATAVTLLRAAIAWHVFALTESALHLGLVGLASLPALFLALVSGAVADAADRRTIVVVAQLVSATGAGLLLAATLAGPVPLPLVYGTVLVVACSFAFEGPARVSLLPTLVTPERFPRAVTVATTNQALAFMTGPMLAGSLIAAGGVTAAYAGYVGLIALSLAALAAMRPPARRVSGTRVTVAAIREGLEFLRGKPVILACMALDLFAVVFGGATALLPIYAAEILRVGAHGYGVLASSLEVGALVTSVALVALPPIRRSGAALLAAVAVYGVATVVFGLSRWFPLSVAAYVVAGMADQVSVVLRSTIIQLATPDELRGRVASVNQVFIGASNQLGALESGLVAAATTPTFAVVSGGLGCLAVVAAMGWRLGELRRYRIESGVARG